MNEVKQIGQLFGTDTEPNPSGGRVYDANGIMRTLGSGHGMSQPYIAIPQATKGGYIECKVGGVADLSYPNSATRRGRVQDGGTVSPTITAESNGLCRIEPCIAAIRGRNPDNPTSRQSGLPTEQMLEIKVDGTSNTLTTVQKDNMVVEPNVLIPKRTEFGKSIRKAYESGTVEISRHAMMEMEPRADGISNTLTTVQKDNLLCQPPFRIRKLTPRECWRLMGFHDTDFGNAEQVNSNSQLYKQAGNSIVVDVLMAIFKEMLA